MDNQTPVSNLNMDYANNARFFDPANSQKVKKILISSIPFFALAVLCFILMRVLHMFFLSNIALIPLVIGGGLLFYAFSKNVKEKEVTQYFHEARKEVRIAAGEALSYPSDLENESLLFMGAVTDKLPEGAFPARKIKDGRMLTQELQFTHIYVRVKSGLAIYSRTLSLVEEKVIDEQIELPFADFDQAVIEPVGVGNKANILKIMKGKDVIFTAPLFINDYAQDEFLTTMLHTRERALKG